MRRKSTNSIGALHPVLFFLFVYGLSLFMALFVCRTVYYSINGDPVSENNQIVTVNEHSSLDATAVR
jgi:hypothetical protein